jgi:NAD-dependent dihydropyrimidine dehydrogenase PreA subunit/flavodoxin
MIFYFSGTGNSLWVAKELAAAYNEKLISISEELILPNNHFSYSVSPDEKIFLVFPIHSWGVSVLPFRFLNKLQLVDYQKQAVYMVCTCGDNCGYAAKIVKRILQKKSIVLTKSYSIQMPNNYILMKGFGTDTKELETQKLADAPQRLQQIVEDINSACHCGLDPDTSGQAPQSPKNKNLYVQGNFSFLKTCLVYPLFREFGIKQHQFYAKDNCVSCGLCISVCPTKTIFWRAKKPKWHKTTCVQCTACINRCPEQAIEYGKISETQGRYHHPIYDRQK